MLKTANRQLSAFAIIILVMANLSAVTDLFLHQDIPYFDAEHLIVGTVTGLASGILFGVLLLYIRRLNNALGDLRNLESFLPICAYCHKIRINDQEPHEIESWQPIESYISERMETRFSHGICPECFENKLLEFEENDAANNSFYNVNR